MEYIKAFLFSICSLALVCSCFLLFASLLFQQPVAIALSLTGVLITSSTIYNQLK